MQWRSAASVYFSTIARVGHRILWILEGSFLEGRWPSAEQVGGCNRTVFEKLDLDCGLQICDFDSPVC